MSAGLRAIGIGVPARDEADTVAGCIASLDLAAGRIGVPVHLVVVADGCRDTTAEEATAAIGRARTIAGRVLTTEPVGVGRARALALDTVLRDLAIVPAQAWLATTDADTTVAPTWLLTQQRWAQAGFDAVAGLVEVAWNDHDDRLAGRYRRSIAPSGLGIGHHHVHGANLGLRGSWWMTVGGCGDLTCGEDHELWSRLRRAGARTIGVDDLAVTTSGRLTGRVDGGFASYLSALAVEGPAP